jgi:hypothetical protein
LQALTHRLILKSDYQGEKSMTILENINKKIAEAVADKTGQVSDQLQDEAIAAILGGLDSDAWTTYMKNFVDADRPEQLLRLRAKDSAGNDPYMRKAIAYLVANATCGIFTRLRLVERLEDGFLDSGLENG